MGLESLELLELLEFGDSVGGGVLPEELGVDGGEVGVVPVRSGSVICIRSL